MAISNQVPAEKVCITGIPVYPYISLESRSREEIRADQGWQAGITTILAVGSRRSNRLMEMLNIVNHYGAPLQLAVVCGKNEELYQQLNRVNWHIPIHLYNFVDRMPALMKSSDLIISKAGGLIVTESLACGLPMMLTEIIPGQETGNAEYVKAAQAGVMVNTPVDLLEALHHFLEDNGAMLRRYTENARLIGKPQSAFAVADILWQAAHGRAGCRKNANPQNPQEGSAS